jgi:hypothetical protein
MNREQCIAKLRTSTSEAEWNANVNACRADFKANKPATNPPAVPDSPYPPNGLKEEVRSANGW